MKKVLSGGSDKFLSNAIGGQVRREMEMEMTIDFDNTQVILPCKNCFCGLMETRARLVCV